MSKKGFTVIELVFSIVFLLTAFGLFFTQKNDLQKSMRDQQRKTSVNSIYFNLKEVYFKQNNYFSLLTQSFSTGFVLKIISELNHNLF